MTVGGVWFNGRPRFPLTRCWVFGKSPPPVPAAERLGAVLFDMYTTFYPEREDFLRITRLDRLALRTEPGPC